MPASLFVCFSLYYCPISLADWCIDRNDTQPTTARWEPVYDGHKAILGGTKAGGGAWGIAYVDTLLELPNRPEMPPPIRVPPPEPGT